MLLDRPNGDLYYEEHGDGSSIIVYLNGFASGISNWYPVIRPLKKNYRNILFDYIGTGESTNNKGYDFCFENYCMDLGDLIDHLGSESAHLVGYSMGGWIAQEFTTRYPERVDSLTLVNTSSRIFSRQDWIIKHFIDVLGTGDISSFSRLMFISYYSPEYFEKHLDNLERVRKLADTTFEKHDLSNWDSLLKSCLSFNAESRLPDLKLPVLGLSGEHDILCPRMTAVRMSELIPKFRWHEVAGVGHAIPMETHRKLAFYLQDFLKNNYFS